MIPTYEEICKKNNIKVDSRDNMLIKEFEDFIVPELKNFSCSELTISCNSKFLAVMDRIKQVYFEKGWKIDYIVTRMSGCEIGNTFRLTISGIK